MFTSIVFAAVLASSAVLRSQAIVEPNEPGPGDTFNQGATCHIGWGGDVVSGSTTAWKNMAIELMTGPNEAMVHLTTVATGQDGTVAGTFDYTCPEVTPNAPIYFYQFSAPGTSNFTWTGRFIIAATDGSSTAATETEQSNGQTVLWGKGALVDASTATGPPTFNSTGSSAGSNSASTGASAGASAGASGPSSQSQAVYPAGATSPAGSATHSTPVAGNANNAASTSSSAPQSSTTGKSAAIAVGLDMRMWPVLSALSASALAFTILL
ncbi:hypothetical protein C8R44DRAFT_977901 [Mycena epipterygia]|nr:hypothetical protein C8R44DRAFT_977901 [Mycena epipterygia]